VSGPVFDLVPEGLRESARSALSAAGAERVTDLRALGGGGSGALAYRAESGGRAYLLRLERGMNALQNRHHYPCLRAAADAGIAPPVRFVDPSRGISVVDFVTERPLAEYPGGPPALARDLGLLIRRLQDTAAFPMPDITYRDLVGRMLAFVRDANVFAPGLLDPHVAGYERIRAAYPWDDAARVSSHNDPNPRNVLFDGARLWLVDWETACANDPLTDVAVLTHELASTPELQDTALCAWLGREPDRAVRARLALMRQVTRLFFACALLRLFAGNPERRPDSDLTALTSAEFLAALQAGRLKLGSAELLYAFAKMFLAAYLAALRAPDFEESLAAAAGG
jgi:aminoglycoside phosphotransferase (APT) family kinase protein